MSSPHRESRERPSAALMAISTAERRRAHVIVNPYATTVSERLRDLVVTALASRYDVEASQTTHRGHATELAMTAASGGCDVVVAFGGDGTVNEVANGLAGSETPLAPLPGGSANVFCKLLGVPADIVDATEHLLALADRWEPRQVDLAFVAGRHYTFSAGIGIDATVVRQVDAHPALKRRFGPKFFLASALWTLPRHYLHDPPRIVVSVGAQRIAAVTAIIQNAEHYTYWGEHPIDMAAGASLSSGTLSGLALHRADIRDLPSLLRRGLAGAGRVSAHRQVSSFTSAGEVSLESTDGRPIPLQLDGDYIGEVTQALFSVRPRALTVIA